MIPRYARAFAEALLAVPAENISIPGFNPPLVGRPEIAPSTRPRYGEEEEEKRKLLGRAHDYTFSIGSSFVELSVQFYLNLNEHWRLFAYCKKGMLFSINLTLAQDGSDVIPLRQTLKSATRGATAEERSTAMDALAGHLRTLGLRVSEDRVADLGDFDAKRGRFLRTTASEFIRNFVTISVLKGHYMGNKGYRLPEVDQIAQPEAMDELGLFTSSRLTPGQIYSRADLKELFSITDATINNGTFHVKPWRSVWLFITEEKTADRTPYEDLLQGDVLHMQGQTEGKTDNLLIDHTRLDLELLLFYRKRKNEHPHGGFVYEGPFEYVSHQGTRPTGFVLRRVRERTLDAEFESTFDPHNLTDDRKRAPADVVVRPGQAAFRKELLRAYNGRCAVTGYDFAVALEAAHICEYTGESTDVIENGLLLRLDVHRLFDRGHLAIDSATMTIRLSDALKPTVYGELAGRKISLPADRRLHPSKEALNKHRKKWGL